ncbi:hypothetical protein B0H14DRAFT_2574038 [Mycena olivaceomarginata]|nr:hypothetical protein B0H14DRAFT_2574038 [Mycena olivaceomarginata]
MTESGSRINTPTSQRVYKSGQGTIILRGAIMEIKGRNFRAAFPRECLQFPLLSERVTLVDTLPGVGGVHQLEDRINETLTAGIFQTRYIVPIPECMAHWVEARHICRSRRGVLTATLLLSDSSRGRVAPVWRELATMDDIQLVASVAAGDLLAFRDSMNTTFLIFHALGIPPNVRWKLLELPFKAGKKSRGVNSDIRLWFGVHVDHQ